MLHKWRNSLLP